MEKSGGYRREHLRAILKLSHAVHTEIDPVARKRRLLDGLCDLFGAPGGLSVITHVPPPPAEPRTLFSVGTGAWDGRPHDAFALTRAANPGLVRPAPAPPRYSARGPRHPPRHFPAPAWEVAGPAGRSSGSVIRHCMRCPLPRCGERVIACLQVGAPAGGSRAGRRYTRRDRDLLGLLHREMTWVYQPDLLLASPAARSLTPREQETLRHLLAGKSEKAIAGEMDLRHNTVHHYVKVIYRRFETSTRGELLARWAQA